MLAHQRTSPTVIASSASRSRWLASFRRPTCSRPAPSAPPGGARTTSAPSPATARFRGSRLSSAQPRQLVDAAPRRRRGSPPRARARRRRHTIGSSSAPPVARTSSLEVDERLGSAVGDGSPGDRRERRALELRRAAARASSSRVAPADGGMPKPGSPTSSTRLPNVSPAGPGDEPARERLEVARARRSRTPSRSTRGGPDRPARTRCPTAGCCAGTAATSPPEACLGARSRRRAPGTRGTPCRRPAGAGTAGASSAWSGVASIAAGRSRASGADRPTCACAHAHVSVTGGSGAPAASVRTARPWRSRSVELVRAQHEQREPGAQLEARLAGSVPGRPAGVAPREVLVVELDVGELAGSHAQRAVARAGCAGSRSRLTAATSPGPSSSPRSRCTAVSGRRAAAQRHVVERELDGQGRAAACRGRRVGAEVGRQLERSRRPRRGGARGRRCTRRVQAGPCRDATSGTRLRDDRRPSRRRGRRAAPRRP